MASGSGDRGRLAYILRRRLPCRLHLRRHPHRNRAANHQPIVAQPPRDDAAAKNAPLVEDIRLLGRILGDVIREQEGAEAYELIERIRQLSVAYRLKRDAQRRARARPAAEEPVGRPDGERDPRASATSSHLANIAEDRHHVRRRDHPRARRATMQARLAGDALRAPARAGIRAADVAATLAHAYISPVLTAHPTEVQRKSILDAERAIARLVGERDDAAHARATRDDNEALIRARVTQLWQTRMLRYTKLTVADEIENALSLLPRRPSCARCRALYRGDRTRAARATRSRPFFRMGHWIGGDRDGNPNVSAAHAARARWRARPRWRCAST